ncbi:MAG TPA: XRE family transcriptional regulator [Planctomycetota bacterium]|jgi:transcriptional regulator with XRE-family HTH domain|nr:XRE family transcriptional regulator [Planctomycetota bacterium]
MGRPPSSRPAPSESALGDRVKELRQKKGWTLDQLSGACGVSRSMLSQIERNGVNPTVAVALRIAQAFGIALGALVDAPAAAARIEVVRGDDQSTHFRSDKDCRIRTLSPLHLEKDVEFYEIRLRPGGALRSAPHFAGTREILTVHQGSVRVSSGGTVQELSAGDSAHYPADVPHEIVNSGRDTVVAYLVDLYTPGKH